MITERKKRIFLPSSRLLLLPLLVLLLLLLLLLLLRGVALLLLLLLLLLLPPLLPVLPEVMMLLLVVLLLLVSAFRDGRLAGGRLAEGTLPRICIPCLRGTWFFWADGSLDSPCVGRRCEGEKWAWETREDVRVEAEGVKVIAEEDDEEVLGEGVVGGFGAGQGTWTGAEAGEIGRLFFGTYSTILVHAIYIQRCEFGLGISLSPTSPQCTHAANRSSLALASFATYCRRAFHANRSFAGSLSLRRSRRFSCVWSIDRLIFLSIFLFSFGRLFLIFVVVIVFVTVFFSVLCLFSVFLCEL